MRTIELATAAIFAVATAMTSVAAARPQSTNSTVTAADRSRIESERYRRTGGFVSKPGAQKGTIGFVNAQDVLPEGDIERVIATLKTQMKHNIRVVRGAKPDGLPTAEDVSKVGMDATVFVVSDARLPSLLVGADDRWALVNVNHLKRGLADCDEERLSKRFRGELMRAFAYACGMGSSQYPGNVFDATCVKDLDSYNPDQMIMDMVQRCSKYLKDIGVTPDYVLPYKKACREGWAPAPTNDVQRAIWERVKADKERGPTNPIKIEPPKAK